MFLLFEPLYSKELEIVSFLDNHQLEKLINYHLE